MATAVEIPKDDSEARRKAEPAWSWHGRFSLTVVIGGRMTSTLLTLVVLPTVYVWMFGRREGIAQAPGGSSGALDATPGQEVTP